MVDPESLTLGVVAAALIVKAAEQAGESAASTAAGVLGRLVDAVRNRFSDKGDDQGGAVLARAEDPPVDQAQVARLAEAIDHQANDAGWAEELSRLVQQAESDGIDVSGTVQQVWGDSNVVMANVWGSTINVERPGPPGT